MGGRELIIQQDQRLLQIKTEVLEEIQLKMVPENILSNVSEIHRSYRIITDAPVHDPLNAYFRVAMAYAQAICLADCRNSFLDVSMLSAQPSAEPIPHQPQNRSNVYD